MTRATYGLDDTVRAYVVENQPPEHPLLAERDRTREVDCAITVLPVRERRGLKRQTQNNSVYCAIS